MESEDPASVATGRARSSKQTNNGSSNGGPFNFTVFKQNVVKVVPFLCHVDEQKRAISFTQPVDLNLTNNSHSLSG